MEEMLAYIGTKLINAKPMTRWDYITMRGLELPYDENGNDEGYLVEYVNSTKSNTDMYDGYISWSPKAEFENAYEKTEGLSFGLAIDAMKKGYQVARTGWNGANMFIFLVPCSVFKVNRLPLLGIFNEGHDVKYQDHIDMKTAIGTVVPWLASQSDMLATDWCIVPTPIAETPGELYR